MVHGRTLRQKELTIAGKNLKCASDGGSSPLHSRVIRHEEANDGAWRREQGPTCDMRMGTARLKWAGNVLRYCSHGSLSTADGLEVAEPAGLGS